MMQAVLVVTCLLATGLLPRAPTVPSDGKQEGQSCAAFDIRNTDGTTDESNLAPTIAPGGNSEGETDDTSPYSRSLRNLLVSGNECGRVFPAGVGPGSPSRDAANWLPSRFSLSVETRRRYGWLRMMVFPGARLFPSPNLVPFGRVAARERQGALSRRAW